MSSPDRTFSLPKSKIWAVHKSKTTGRYYYYNIITGESAWRRPVGLEDDEINFPEGYTNPESENGLAEGVVEACSESDSKKSEKDDRGLETNQQHNKIRVRNIEELTTNVSKLSEVSPVHCKRKKSATHSSSVRIIKELTTNVSKLPEVSPIHCKRKESATHSSCVRNIKELTTNVSKHSGDLPKHCNRKESAKRSKNISRRVQPKRLQDGTSESDLPNYTDSDEDQPPAAKKAKKTGERSSKSQSRMLEQKAVDWEQKTFDISSAEEWKLENTVDRPCERVIEQYEINDQCEDMDWSPDSRNNNIDEIEYESDITEWSNLKNEVTPMEIDTTSPGDTCLVIDTNIILDFSPWIELLAQSELADGSKAIVIIPWQVLKELDNLKCGRDFTRFRCRSAIKFLHRCFNDKSSNVIAQNAHSANLSKDLIEIEVPDDYILACCLQITGLDRKTVLLTNDINLCNKANANNIEAYTREEFTKLTTNNKTTNRKIKKIFDETHIPKEAPVQKRFLPYSAERNFLPRIAQKVSSLTDKEDRRGFTSSLLETSDKASETLLSKTLIIPNTSASLPLKEPSINKPSSNQTKLFQAIQMPLKTKEQRSELLEYVKLSPTDFTLCTNKLEKFKIVVAEFLFSILKEGMSKTFKGDWTKRVFLKPPWTVKQLCACLQKHWISLTECFFPKDIEEQLKSLQFFLGDIDKKSLSLPDLDRAINICFSISLPLKEHFKDSVKKFDTQLESLLSKSLENYCEGDSASLEKVKEVPYSRKSSTQQIESSRCSDLLSRILNETSQFLVCLNLNMVNCFKNGSIDSESRWLPVLSDMMRVLPQKISLTTNIICCLLEIIHHNSPESSINKLTLCLTEGSDFCDPFFSKEDVKRFAAQSSNKDLIQKYWRTYEELRAKLLTASKQLVVFRY